MRARTLRVALSMAAECERRIVSAGRIPPDQAELVAALLPRARDLTRAARHVNTLRWLLARALDDADAAGVAAREAIVNTAAACAAAAPERRPAPVLAGTVPFDAARHVVILTAPSRDRVAMPSPEAS